jgi:hypothetical protein
MDGQRTTSDFKSTGQFVELISGKDEPLIWISPKKAVQLVAFTVSYIADPVYDDPI